MKTARRSPKAASGSEQDDVRSQAETLTENVTRLTQACAASTAEAVAGSIQVFANLASDLAAAATRPLRGRRDEDQNRMVPADMVDSANRAIRDLADVIGRSQRQFVDSFQDRSDVADRPDAATDGVPPHNVP